jgi:hypothetical protein
MTSEPTNPSTNRLDDLYIPAMTARPTFGRLESFLRQRLGRYGVVRIPYDVLGR